MCDARSPKAQPDRSRSNAPVDYSHCKEGDLALLDEWDQNGHRERVDGTIDAFDIFPHGYC